MIQIVINKHSNGFNAYGYSIEDDDFMRYDVLFDVIVESKTDALKEVQRWVKTSLLKEKRYEA